MGQSSLYQVNTRVWLRELSGTLGRDATLTDITDFMLDEWVGQGFRWIYLLSVWQTGEAGRIVSQTNPAWRQGFLEQLPDLKETDICGSGFAIKDYSVDIRLGGIDALIDLRRRMHDRGLRLMLDFVPNHTSLDHSWIAQHPDYYVRGSEDDLARAPQNYVRLGANGIFAHGRDPYFDGWVDTAQLNYGNDALRVAMTEELVRVSQLCDGLRCDMAMLVLPEIFHKTWGIQSQPFWLDAISKVRQKNQDFTFMAEVYWELDGVLQAQGFNYTYDKRLYDRLRQGDANSVRQHLWAEVSFQEKCARFLENHDEERAAAVFPFEKHQASAIVTFLSPGLRFFHQGQFEGRRKHTSVHLSRRAQEEPDNGLVEFYSRLLVCLEQDVVHSGTWKILESLRAWDGNGTDSAFITFGWIENSNVRILVVVNYSAHQSQCYIDIPRIAMSGGNGRSTKMMFRDLMSAATYERDVLDVATRGLYIDLGPWEYNVFILEPGDPGVLPWHADAVVTKAK